MSTTSAAPAATKARRKTAVADGPEAAAKSTVKRVNLALQGGGAHGAFTWGVLDLLLEDPRIAIEGISGTSAGALNAAVLACGLSEGGSATARAKLEDFWHQVSELGRLSPLQAAPWDRASGNWNMDHSPIYLAFEVMSRLLSPYQLNPMDYNPLREVLERTVDLACLQACREVKLFVSATNVRSGKIRVFGNPEITIDALLASACLPTLFQTVEIDGEPYWDGGFMGNPPLYPLFYKCDSRDLVIVQINPIERDGIPKTAREILDRMNEITFNSSLMREMRAVAFVTRLIDEGLLDDERYKRVLVHMIEDETEMQALGFSSKLMADWSFLTHLRDLGRQAAARWLEQNFDRIGSESTLDIAGKFL
jgi:NTE family protein